MASACNRLRCCSRCCLFVSGGGGGVDIVYPTGHAFLFVRLCAPARSKTTTAADDERKCPVSRIGASRSTLRKNIRKKRTTPPPNRAAGATLPERSAFDTSNSSNRSRVILTARLTGSCGELQLRRLVRSRDTDGLPRRRQPRNVLHGRVIHTNHFP